MTKTFEEVPVATVEVIPTFDGNEIKFKPSSKLGSYLIAEGEVELYLRTEQQPLPEVPEFVGKTVELLKKYPNSSWTTLCESLGEEGVTWLNEYQQKDEKFGFGELNNKLFVLFHLAINGYTVQKPKRFYLKNKLTKMYLADSVFEGVHETFHEVNADKFTQEEIDKMEDTGSYEKIEVEE